MWAACILGRSECPPVGVSRETGFTRSPGCPARARARSVDVITRRVSEQSTPSSTRRMVPSHVSLVPRSHSSVSRVPSFSSPRPSPPPPFDCHWVGARHCRALITNTSIRHVPPTPCAMTATVSQRERSRAARRPRSAARPTSVSIAMGTLCCRCTDPMDHRASLLARHSLLAARELPFGESMVFHVKQSVAPAPAPASQRQRQRQYPRSPSTFETESTMRSFRRDESGRPAC